MPFTLALFSVFFIYSATALARTCPLDDARARAQWGAEFFSAVPKPISCYRSPDCQAKLRRKYEAMGQFGRAVTRSQHSVGVACDWSSRSISLGKLKSTAHQKAKGGVYGMRHKAEHGGGLHLHATGKMSAAVAKAIGRSGSTASSGGSAPSFPPIPEPRPYKPASPTVAAYKQTIERKPVGGFQYYGCNRQNLCGWGIKNEDTWF